VCRAVKVTTAKMKLTSEDVDLNNAVNRASQSMPGASGLTVMLRTTDEVRDTEEGGGRCVSLELMIHRCHLFWVPTETLG
jgi:anti-sigma regulatory factor (Ser/Thr protein kinase)